MRRTTTLFCLGLALAFALTGCNGDKMPDVTPTPAGGATPTPGVQEDGSFGSDDLFPGETGTPGGFETGVPDNTMTPGIDGPTDTPDPNGTMNPAGSSVGSAGTAIHPNAGTGSNGTTRSAGSSAGGAVRDAARGVGNAARDVANGVGNAARDIGAGINRAVH